LLFTGVMLLTANSILAGKGPGHVYGDTMMQGEYARECKEDARVVDA
jgi:hypothetical protein